MRFRREASADSGQSLVELLIGIAIAAIIVGSVVGAVVLSVRINKQSITTKVASSLGQEIMDNLRSISEGRWQRIYDLDTKGASSAYYIFNEDTIIAQDTISSAGKFSSLALDSLDNPVIAYYSVIDNMKVLHCNDGDCAGDDESIETADSGGFFNSIQLDGSEHPVIAHYNDTTDDFRIVHCNDVNCSSAVSESMADTKVSGFSLQLDSSGNPVVSYQRDVGKKIYLLHCNDSNCSGGDESVEIIDAIGVSGDYTSLQLTPASGLPVIAYADNGNLSVVRCSDVNCSGNDPQNKVDTSVNNTAFVSMALDAQNYPVVSYYDPAPRNDLKILHCNDVSCLGDDESIVTVDTSGGESTSIQIDSFGNPVVSYIANNKLKILHCNDPNCSGGDESIIVVDDANPDANISGTSLRLDSLGNPVVSYYDDVNDDLKVLHCDDPNCDANVFTALGIASGTESIIIGGTTYTRWFSVENVSRDSSGDIDPASAGGSEDTSTQKITTTVQWLFGGDTEKVTIVEYFTRFTRNRVTVFTDWGGGQSEPSIISVDVTDSVGWYNSLQLDSSGYPVVSYYDSTNDDLKLVHCSDVNCAGGDESIVIADDLPASFAVVGDTSLQLDSSGYPVIAYHDVANGDLKLIHCNDPNCSGGNESIVTVDATGDVGRYPSIQLDSSGYPVVSYWDRTNGDLKLIHCNDPNCSGGDESIISVDATGAVGEFTSLQLDSSGYPVVSYYDRTNIALKLLHCNDVNCSGGNESIVTVESGTGFFDSSLQLDSSGYPVIAYFRNDDKDLKLAHCNDANCSGGDESIVTVDATGSVGSNPSLQLDSSGYPVISYYDSTNSDLKLAYCNDANCAGGGESIVVVDPVVVHLGSAGPKTSLQLDSSGYPVISYHDFTNNDLKLVHCNDPNCAGSDGDITRPDSSYFSSTNIDFATGGEIKL